MKPTWCRTAVLLLVLTFVLSAVVAPARASSTASFTLAYTLTLAEEDHPEVEVAVAGAPDANTRFTFGVESGVLAGMGDLRILFPVIAVTAANGSPLDWIWQGEREIVVKNGPARDFIIHYSMDALRLGRGPEVKWAIFRKQAIFFTADAIFLLPTVSPDRITVQFYLPEGVRVYASLPEVEGRYVATPDLWGNLLDDFPKAYFSGGRPTFDFTRYTPWGDTYRYVWFDRDPIWAVWSPSGDTTPWEDAYAEMALTEKVSQFFREQVGPLPAHIVLFTNLKWGGPGVDSVKTNTDWFHHMEIWPPSATADVIHHVFHAYSFFVPQSRLAFSEQAPIGRMLTEGLPTYFEVTLPGQLFGEEYQRGKLYEFYVYERRGAAENSYQLTYNRPALQVYLLDQYIRRVTGGTSDVMTFTRALWDKVKANPHPQMVTDSTIVAAFGSVVGEANQGYLSQVAARTTFTDADFAALLPDFRAYVRTTADRYFWGNQLLFLAYLDLTANLGGEWPHFATSQHQVLSYRPAALHRFHADLASNPGSLSKAGLVDALNRVAGDHTAFFEFWAERGFELDPGSLAPLDGWGQAGWDAASTFPIARSIDATLQTEHYLSGLPQEATIVLDQPAPGREVELQVSLFSADGYPPKAEADQAISGANVRHLSSMQVDFGSFYATRAFFRVTTSDPERRRFSFRLTLPSFASHPQFKIYDPNGAPMRSGDVYYLHPFDPIPFALQSAGSDLVLPETKLAGESFLIHAPDGVIRGRPGECVAVSSWEPVQVDLLDTQGYLRGRQQLRLPEQCAALVPIQVALNGNPLAFDVPPARVEGRLLVPVRTLSEALGARVNWEPATQTVTLQRGDTVIALVISNRTALVDGKLVALDAATEVRAGRTLVPLRLIAESFGLTVRWDEPAQTAFLTSK